MTDIEDKIQIFSTPKKDRKRVKWNPKVEVIYFEKTKQLINKLYRNSNDFVQIKKDIYREENVYTEKLDRIKTDITSEKPIEIKEIKSHLRRDEKKKKQKKDYQKQYRERMREIVKKQNEFVAKKYK